MASVSLYAIASVVIVSLVSFAGIIAMFWDKNKIDHLLISFISLSAGTLFGGAFLHLIPEAVEGHGSFSISVSFLILAGIIVFFLLDKLIHWKHFHSHSTLIHEGEHKKSIIYLNLLGDGIHNLLDGLVIAGSYMVSIPTGIAATVAVVAHEFPQELVDFGVLLYSGLRKWKAMLFNFLSALTAVIGAVIGLALGSGSERFILGVIPFAAGAFIYIAGSNLIPELLSKEHKIKQLVQQLFMFVLGILIMYALLFLE